MHIPSLNQDLRNIFVGQYLNISSRYPPEILELLDTTPLTCDTIILYNLDVWRYDSSLNEIFSHPKLKDKKVILHNLGYTNTKFNDLRYKISIPGLYWIRHRTSKSFVPLSSDLNYGFSCLNHKNNIHRTLLGYNLYVNNLLPDMIFTQNIKDEHYLDRVSEDALELKLDRFTEYRNLLPIRHLSEIDKIGDLQAYTHAGFTDAYCTIVTESECEEYPYYQNINLPISTEKSYKPFLSRQIPIMLAARGHIEYLENLGFDLMRDLYPEGFDNFPVLQKIDAIVKIVSKGREFIKDFYFSHLREIQHNYELVNSNKVETLVLQQVKDFLYE